MTKLLKRKCSYPKRRKWDEESTELHAKNTRAMLWDIHYAVFTALYSRQLCAIQKSRQCTQMVEFGHPICSCGDWI